MTDKLNLTKNEPSAQELSNSMRCMGYSLESAIADIVDNSITAKATEIEIKFPVSPDEVCIAICDNGNGMTKEELFDAMKYGSTLKGKLRSEDDLGRFGMGLKSASHSQCRRLSVASKKNGNVSAYVWDLDVIDEKHEWLMIDCSENDIAKIPFVDYLNQIKKLFPNCYICNLDGKVIAR